MTLDKSYILLLILSNCFILYFCVKSVYCDFVEEEYGVKYASKCEACKVTATELELHLEETKGRHDVLETGYNIDGKNKKVTKYKKSELRLLEALESVCENILKYNIHKERTDSSRFARGMSQTFQTLHGLVNKGVKVDLGIPFEMWDKPSAEITDLKTKCESLIEDNEDLINSWYMKHQDTTHLVNYLCAQHLLNENEQNCLNDVPTEKSKGDKIEL